MTGFGVRLEQVSERRLRFAILALALLLRLPFAAVEFNRVADEIWQYIEPAHRLLTGQGIITWEYRAGMRSWLIPTLVAGPMWVGRLLFGDTGQVLLPLRLLLTLFSLLIVWSGFMIGRRVSRIHAITAALAMAVSFEPILMGARVMSEAIGTVFLFAAAVPLLNRTPGREGQWLLGGLLLGLSIASRLQFTAAAGTLALLGCGLNWRKWAWLIAGGAVALAIDGGANLAQGEVPLRWMVENVRLNLVENLSARYGVEPATWYLTSLMHYWGATLPLVLIAVCVGARRQPALLAAALVNLAVHSAIPHKEFRFIFPSIALLTLVGALGSAEIIVDARRHGRRWGEGAALLALATWGGASFCAALWSKNNHAIAYRSEIAMWRAEHATPGLCGIASVGIGPLTTAYAYVDRRVPAYLFWPNDDLGALLAHAQAYNVVQADGARGPQLVRGGYVLKGCFATGREAASGAPPRLCLFMRPGSCDGRGSQQYLENEVRKRLRI